MRTVILGSGVIGVTTAWQLVKEGHEVVVIDRQPVAANETNYANVDRRGKVPFWGDRHPIGTQATLPFEIIKGLHRGC